MNQTINAIRLALALVPSIVEAIKTVEIAGIPGADKAAAVVSIVLAALDSLAPDLAKSVGLDRVTAFIHKAIDILVALLNKAGVLPKGQSRA